MAEDYIEQGDLEEDFHRYRACAFFMLKVNQNCPESYKAEAESVVKKTTQRMKEIRIKEQSTITATHPFSSSLSIFAVQ